MEENLQQSDSDPDLSGSPPDLVNSPLVGYSSFKPKKWPQIVSSLIVTIGAFGLGNTMGWSSPALPDLKKGGQLGVLSDSMASWIGSIVNVGAFFSAFIVIGLSNKIGIKYTLIAISVPFVGGWLLIGLAQNFAMILVGRFITGLCGATFTFLGPIYISEIAEPEIRGTLSSALILVLVLGIVFMYVAGTFLSWIWLSIVCSFVPFIFLCCMMCIPNTPLNLISFGQQAAASEALQWLRGASRSSQIETELTMIQGSFEASRRTSTSIHFTAPQVYRPLLIVCMLMFFQQLGGINAILFYLISIFDASGASIDPHLASIFVGITQIIMSGVSTFLVDRAGRKILLIISDAGMAVSLFSLAIYFYLKEHNENVESLGWLPLTSLIVYMITYNIGLGSVPWVIMGEIFPLRLKLFASMVASSFCWGLSFLVTGTFSFISLELGTFGTFTIFGVISAIGSLYALFYVPETNGRSLIEIEALFRQ